MIPKISFAKIMTGIVCIYILIASVYPVKNPTANIGFLMSLATLWANPPSANEDIKTRK